MGNPLIRTHNNRVWGLDLLRAFAILFVVYGHGITYIDPAISKRIYVLPLFDGVSMFFVLSGFLIGRILLKTFEKKNFHFRDLTQFWIRRWFRTIPNYILVLTFLAIVSPYFNLPQPDALFQYYFFSQNFASPQPQFFQESWSLTIEEWFYLIVPLLFFISAKFCQFNRQKLTLFWIAFIIISVTTFRFYRVYSFNFPTFHDWDSSFPKQVVTRLDSIMFGVLGAYINIYFSGFWHKIANKSFIAGIILLLVDHYFFMILSRTYYLYFVLTLRPVGALLLLPKLSALTRGPSWIVRIITFISVISYSMYLLNFSVIGGVIMPTVKRNILDLDSGIEQHIYLIQYVMYWFISIALSFLLYQYFERPMTALRERFHARGQGVVKAYTAYETSHGG